MDPTEAQIHRVFDRMEDLKPFPKPQPNWLEWAGVTDRELSHSSIIAKLLDPCGDHGMGLLFLKRFLDKVAPCDKFPKLWEAIERPGVTAIPEYTIFEKRRVDIVLFVPGWGVVAIENKVWAGEQEVQLKEYYEWATSGGQRAIVVFLTPTGHKSKTADSYLDKIINLSYLKLAGILSVAHAQDDEAAVLIGQYADACRKIYQRASGESVMCNMPETVREKFRNKKSGVLADAVQLADWVDRYHNGQRKVFWDTLKKELQDHIENDDNLKSNWTVLEANPFEADAGISLLPKTKPPGEGKKAHYGRFSIRLELETSGGLFYGICRGPEGKGNNPGDTEQKLIDHFGAGKPDSHFKTGGWWSVWKKVDKSNRHVASKGRANLAALERALNDQNMISTLADALLDLVDAVGDEVTRLDKEYPY